MKKVCIFLISCLAIIVVLLAVHFVTPLQKLNECMAHSCKNNVLEDAENDLSVNDFVVSYDNYIALRAGDYNINDDEFANVKSNMNIKHITLKDMQIVYDVRVNIESFNPDNDDVRTYKSKKEIKLKFYDFKWHIFSIVERQS